MMAVVQARFANPSQFCRARSMNTCIRVTYAYEYRYSSRCIPMSMDILTIISKLVEEYTSQSSPSPIDENWSQMIRMQAYRSATLAPSSMLFVCVCGHRSSICLCMSLQYVYVYGYLSSICLCMCFIDPLSPRQFLHRPCV